MARVARVLFESVTGALAARLDAVRKPVVVEHSTKGGESSVAVVAVPTKKLEVVDVRGRERGTSRKLDGSLGRRLRCSKCLWLAATAEALRRDRGCSAASIHADAHRRPEDP